MVQSLPSIFLLCAASVRFVAAYVPTPHGVAVTLSSGKTIELAVAGPSSFRVSAISGAAAPTQISSLMVVPPASYAAFSASQNGDIVTLATQTSGSAPAFGSISLNAVTGAFTMTDTTGRILTSSSSLLGGSVAGNNTCAAPRVGCDAVNPVRTPRSPNGLHVASQAACCAACDADPGELPYDDVLCHLELLSSRFYGECRVDTLRNPAPATSRSSHCDSMAFDIAPFSATRTSRRLQHVGVGHAG